MNHFHVFTFNSLTSQILLLTKTSPYHYNIDFSNIWKWYGKNNLLQKSFDCIFNNKQQHKIFFSLRSGPWLMVLLKYILSRENKSKEHGKRRVGAPLLLDQKKKNNPYLMVGALIFVIKLCALICILIMKYHWMIEWF